MPLPPFDTIFPTRRRFDKTRFGIRLLALLVAAMGVINVLSAITPALSNRTAILREFLPLGIRYGSHLAAILAGFALLLLARGLWRHKRVAWALSILALVISAISHLTKGLDWEEASLAASLAIWLGCIRRSFYAQSDAPSIRQGLAVLGGALLFTMAYGVLGFYLLDNHFKIDFGLTDAIQQTLAMFLEFDDTGLIPVTRFGHWFANSIYLVGAGTMGFALFALLRPALLRKPATVIERTRAKAIVTQWGRSSLARFTLFDDKAYWFSPGGSVIAYALVGRVAVALGDPIGPPLDISTAISSFQEYCSRNDWRAAFFQTMPDYREAYLAAGMETLCVGQEAIVPLSTFTLQGRENKSLRGHVNRLRKAGYTTELCPAPHSEALMAELRTVSEQWLRQQQGGEKRFALGWFDETYLQDGPVFVVRSPEGSIEAFANLIPEYGVNEATIDLMRRRQDAASGTMDLLLVGLFEWAKEQGFDTFNLGLSPLMGVGEGEDASPTERALHFVYENANRFYSYKGLYEYKSKFQPEWSPRYLVYPSAASLPAVAYAIVQANNARYPLWQFWRYLRLHPTTWSQGESFGLTPNQ